MCKFAQNCGQQLATSGSASSRGPFAAQTWLILGAMFVRSWSILVLCGGLREEAQEVLHPERAASAQCPRAVPSDPESFDARSLVIDKVDFSFFESREFFVATDAMCSQQLQDVPVRKVPREAFAKQALLEQRSLVKQLNEGLRAVKMQDGTQLAKMRKPAKNVERETILAPVVELHLFPTVPDDATAPWKALVVQRSREVCGRTLYLCEAQEPRCVAELPFEALPFRFLRGTCLDFWSHADLRRSTRFRLMTSAELLLLLGPCTLLLALLWATWTSARLARVETKPHVRAEEKLQDFRALCPAACRLLRCSDVSTKAGPELSLFSRRLEAGAIVQLSELAVADRSSWALAAASLDFWELLSLASGKHRKAVWGRVQLLEEKGWVMVFDEATADHYIMSPEDRREAAFMPHRELQTETGPFCWQLLLLVAAYVSAQWFLLHFLAVLHINAFLAMATGVLGAHVVVLVQLQEGLQMRLEYEEVLEQRQLLLLVAPRMKLLLFLVLGFGLSAGLLVTMAWSGSRQIGPFASLLAFVALHGRALLRDRNGLEKWRQPMLESECQAIVSDQLPLVHDRPAKISKGRGFKQTWARLLLAFAAAFGLCVTGLTVLEAQQMVGKVVHMEFSRGFWAYPTDADTLQSTLLLDVEADLVTLQLQKGEHTKDLTLEIRHPSLPVNLTRLPPQKNDTADYPISLPTGPLYTRISILASGSVLNTRYVVHILRVGTAINVSLTGTFDAEQFSDTSIVTFREERRLQYQQENPVWYIPDLNANANMTISVRILPVCFAPLTQFKSQVAADEGLGLPGAEIAKTCECGKQVWGTGNDCHLQQQVSLDSSSSDMCVFSRRASRKIDSAQHIGSPSSIGMVDALVLWLRDTWHSGKRLQLAVFMTANDQPPASYALHNMPADSASSIENVFEVELLGKVLLQEVMPLLLISSTQDETDTQAEEVPLILKKHAPPIVVKLNRTECFFLPPLETPSSKHAVCGSCDFDSLNWTIADGRFGINATIRLESQTRCATMAGKNTVASLRAVRTERASCSNWCSRYPPWHQNTDVPLVQSSELCIREAARHNIPALFRLTKELITGDKCLEDLGIIGELLSQNLTQQPRELFEKVDGLNPNSLYQGHTLLQVVIEKDNLQNLAWLLGRPGINVDEPDANGDTALVTAGRLCRLGAVQQLLERGANASSVNKKKPEISPGCYSTVVSSILTEYEKHSCSDGDVLKVVHMLKKPPADLFTTGSCDSRGFILRKSVDHGEGLFPAMEAVLEELPGSHKINGKATFQMLFKRGLKSPARDRFILQAAGLLVGRYDVNISTTIEGKRRTPLMEAARLCREPLVRGFLSLGASPTQEVSGHNALYWASKKKCSSSVVSLLSNISSSAKGA
ncbi:unnamed protein product [Symbiodinium microadriaticum]|nr:unnamed protein product [Symbiodinium microadriaticum]CAE7947129.1 unnamed protein product [Symbiodinium sp. KB8]